MKHLINAIAVVLIGATSLSAHADYLVNETPDSRYIYSVEGTVTDKDTGLMWQRCSYGQEWNTDLLSCEGFASTMSWQSALEVPASLVEPKYTNWRLPSINELRTIAAYDKSNPAINTTAFPNSPETGVYWSSSPDVNASNKSWGFSFAQGNDTMAARYSTYGVRLVRNLH